MNPKAIAGFLTACAMTGLFASCAPSPVNSEEPNALVANPSNLTIATPADTVSTKLALVCGCKFVTSITSFTQDTSVIRYKVDAPLSTMATPHYVRFYVAPGAASGTYHARITFYAPDDNNQQFYDTVDVSAIVP